MHSHCVEITMAESTRKKYLKYVAITHIIFGAFLFVLGILDHVYGDVTADVMVRGQMLLGVWAGILVSSKLEANSEYPVTLKQY